MKTPRILGLAAVLALGGCGKKDDTSTETDTDADTDTDTDADTDTDTDPLIGEVEEFQLDQLGPPIGETYEYRGWLCEGRDTSAEIFFGTGTLGCSQPPRELVVLFWDDDVGEGRVSSGTDEPWQLTGGTVGTFDGANNELTGIPADVEVELTGMPVDLGTPNTETTPNRITLTFGAGGLVTDIGFYLDPG